MRKAEISNQTLGILLVAAIALSLIGTFVTVKVIKTGPKISLFINKAGIPAQPNVEKISKASQVSMVVAPSE